MSDMLERRSADFEGEFVLDAKAISEDDNGDLVIEGLAADFNLDDQDEAFEPAAFERGIKAFLENGGPMLYHHRLDEALGQWTEARLEANGLHVKGMIPKPAEGSPLMDVYNKVKRGMIRGLSVGGKFRRREGSDGRPRIFDAGIREISVTPMPVSRSTLFQVATKAFDDDDARNQKALEEADRAVQEISDVLEQLENQIVVADAARFTDHEH